MLRSKNIVKFSVKQLQNFLASFDIILSDIDGVIWQIDNPIKGCLDSLATLQKLNKQIFLVTNNNTCRTDWYCEEARRVGFDLNEDNIIHTTKVIVWYLKKINFSGEILAIVSDMCRNALIKAGIRLAERPKVCEADPRATVKEISDRPSIKAVIIDFDMECDWSKLALAISCLRRKDVLYITGAMNTWVGDQNNRILGPGPLINIVNEHCGKKPILSAKPSQILKDYIFDVCNIKDPRRCLMIGDTIDQDMKFAHMCGFTKLFVGTGCDTIEEAQKEDDTCPDYYIPSLSQLFPNSNNS